MSINIVKLQDQAKGEFNGGAILENKPIGFPQDGGKLRPYSSLFYWAHAWTPGEKSLIGEHPHQGFEIMSFVLKGSIEHFDSKNKDWRKLEEGDAQIIRSGSGIAHAEMVNANSEFFQIWVDPNLNETLNHEPSYNDYTSDTFPVINENNRKTKMYSGEGSPLSMHTQGVEIKEISFDNGNHEFTIDPQKLHSIYVLDGSLKMEDQQIETKDYIIVEDQGKLILKSDQPFKIFMISTPLKLDYRTYADHIR